MATETIRTGDASRLSTARFSEPLPRVCTNVASNKIMALHLGK